MTHNPIRALSGNRHFYIIGLGSVARTVLPLMFDYLGIVARQVTIFSPEWVEGFSEGLYGHHERVAITETNYQQYLGARLKPRDFVLNVATEVDSSDLIALCQSTDAIYLDTVIEPWSGWYDNPALSPAQRSNYALRERVLAQNRHGQSTAVLTHGANPGLVSHFAKAAIEQLSQHLDKQIVHGPNVWAERARAIGLRTIHISEYDSQQSGHARRAEDFFNTWSVKGFVAEASQPAELGWGTHETSLPVDGAMHACGSHAAIWINRPGATVRVKSWTPGVGPYQGFLITHGESISLADHLTQRDESGHVVYRPTVHYAYRPCDAAIASLHDLIGRQWQLHEDKSKVLLSEVSSGEDVLGVLLGYGREGSYWFGSRLTLDQARSLYPNANATSLQVAAGVLGGMVWAMENPTSGLVEPEDMDWRRVLEVATPFLGDVFGEHTSWHPLSNTDVLFPHTSESAEPWDFSNVRIKFE